MPPIPIAHVPVALLIARAYFAPWVLLALHGGRITALVLVSKN